MSSNPMGDACASGFAARSLGGRQPVVSPVRTPVLLSDRRRFPNSTISALIWSSWENALLSDNTMHWAACTTPSPNSEALGHPRKRPWTHIQEKPEKQTVPTPLYTHTHTHTHIYTYLSIYLYAWMHVYFFGITGPLSRKNQESSPLSQTLHFLQRWSPPVLSPRRSTLPSWRCRK